MFRVGIVKNNGEVISQNFTDKDQAEAWVLEQEETVGIKKAVILNQETKEKEIINFGEIK